MPVLFPLHSSSKQPIYRGWNSPSYTGEELGKHSDQALRTDEIAVIDADSFLAAEAWLQEPGVDTPLQQKTKRGRHFFYRASDGERSHSIIPKHLDLKTGRGSYVKLYDPQVYEWLKTHDVSELPPLPVEVVHRLRPAKPTSDEAGWDLVPEGTRDLLLTSLAGALRKQGAGANAIGNTLTYFNEHFVEQGSDPITEADIRRITGSVMRYEPDPFEPDGDLVIIGDDDEVIEPGWRKLHMSNMTLPPPPRWLWKPYLPSGRLVLLDGGEGIGKGLFCAHVATQVTSGAWGEPTPVLWLAAEDDPVEDVQRRLLAAGYERGVNAEVDFVDTIESPTFPAQIRELARQLQRNHYGLVVLDPGRSFLNAQPGTPMSYNDESSVRPGLEQLNKLAKASDATIIFVHHWNKDSQAAVEDRAAGSKAFRQVVRHGLSMAWVGDTETGDGALAVTKSNIGPTGHLMGYSIAAVDEIGGEQIASARWVQGLPLPDHRMADWIKRAVEAEGDLMIELDLETVLDFLRNQGKLVEGVEFPQPRILARMMRGLGMTNERANEIKQEVLERGLVTPVSNNKIVWHEQKALEA